MLFWLHHSTELRFYGCQTHRERVDRASCIQRSRRALQEFHIGGVKTTVPFHLDMLEHAAFIDSAYDLGYVDGLVARGYQFGKEQTDEK